MSKSIDIQAARAVVQTELTQLRELVAEKRQRLEVVKKEIAKAKAAPICLADFRGYIDRFVASKASQYADEIRLEDMAAFLSGTGRVAIADVSWEILERDDFKLEGFFSSSSPLIGGSWTFERLCYFFPEVVSEKLFAEISKRRGDRWRAAEPLAERAPRVESLLSEQSDLIFHINKAEARIGELRIV
ncbi:MAG: hypothetical protein QM702_09630 [Rubrivivax sp.]